MVQAHPMDELSELVHEARDGDRDAFAALHERYSRMVHAILLARVSPAVAEDLVQDVFVTALDRLAGLRDPQQFGSWIGRIARNRATDHVRSRRDLVELPSELGHSARPSAEVRQALDAIRSLPDAYQETLLMRLVEGMTGPEIAKATGMTPGSVRVNLHRGMGLLRERLGVSR